MKIVDKINQAQEENKLSYSFEYFPPKTELGLANLFDRLARMALLKPTFVSCTWGAGGSTLERTLELCSTAQNVYGLETLMHLTCTNMEREKVDQALKEAKEAGIQNILALRGDPPRGDEYWVPCDGGFSHAIDLVKYIREQYGDYFCIGVAGFPEGHMDAPNPGQDLKYLKEKVDAGADFIMTQLFYNVDTFYTWVKNCRDIGITVPIIPGIMPIPTYQSFRRMINLCKVQVPKAILDTLETLKGDDQKVKDYGVKLAVDIMSRLFKEQNICAFQISTLNLERSTRLILQELNLVPQEEKKAFSENVSIWNAVRDPNLAENWDEFPNGRYGDARSPAFGEITYGQNQMSATSEASRKWGYPKAENDITELFVQYILGHLNSLPWCEEALETETEAIRNQLVDINSRGYWTISSQPAVNGAPSQDTVYGWGPKGGYVYQKAFIEFFVSDNQLKELLKTFENEQCITYYAANRKGEFLTNVSDSESQNAVTWGVFPGKEIMQPTIIERANFEAWKDEAYALWTDWEHQYIRGSESAKLLKDIGDRYWLVNVVHNDFQEPNSLFDIILS
ncbi:hypothetical protein DFQ28_009392 [Apophysomyces sp. BC1034]|nr:hypothetical protein DFQ30_009099 [Apophysomyces sp. BC1015]KAG0173082.1 hypothetical protein DFQ29_008109 [Apophysomyces sp. BC1021]KAG0185408.1 hypothetical protein DFQ28_009392 [Apophysomyces sp. BC1034]